MALNAPYTANTIIQSTQVSNDIVGLANGSNDTNTNSMSTFRSEALYNFIASGCIWTADSVGVNKNASMSAGVAYIAGVRVTVAVVTGRVFTASVDTYIDSNSAGTLVYTEVANNAASPALAANSIRVGIIITGGTTIATTGSINQGQESSVLPIASSIPYVTTDSLGNLINPRDIGYSTLGYTEKTTGQSGITAITDITGMSLVVKIPTNVYHIWLHGEATISSASAATTVTLSVTDGSNVVQCERSQIIVSANAAALQAVDTVRKITVIPGTTYTFKLRLTATAASVVNNGDSANKASVLRVSRA